MLTLKSPDNRTIQLSGYTSELVFIHFHAGGYHTKKNSARCESDTADVSNEDMDALYRILDAATANLKCLPSP